MTFNVLQNFFFRFDLHQTAFFNPNIRSRIVQFILDRQRYSRDNAHDFSFGIDKLLDDETYIAAYPLHDGEITTKGSRRHLLFTKWASMKVSGIFNDFLHFFTRCFFDLIEMLPIPTSRLHQRLFRSQNRHLLCLAWLLHLHANHRIGCRCHRLHLLSQMDE